MSSLTLPSCLIVFRLRTLSDNEFYIKGPFPPSRITSLFSRNASPSFSTSGFRGERALKGESRPGASHAGKIQKQPFPAIFWCFHEENREKKEKRKRKRKEEEREKIRKKEERGKTKEEKKEEKQEL